MKLSAKLFFSRRSGSFLAFSPLKHHTNHHHYHNIKNFQTFDKNKQIQSHPFKFLNFQRVSNNTQKSYRVFSPSFGQTSISPTISRGLIVAASSVASKFRNLSTSVETRVNDTNFERIYVQNGLNVKPLVVERIDKDENIAGGQESVTEENNLEGVNGVNVETSPRREETDVEKEAWRLLQEAVVMYCGSPVGTVAANDPGDKQPLNYDQVFIRDFVPSALAFLLKGEGEIVRNFLLHTLQLQSWEKTVDCYSPGQGLMPASFKVRSVALDENKFEEVLDPDFGESAIGRVAPVDSGLWWIILLRAYGKITVTDGSCMIDRRMGIHGHPLEIQALFYSALRCSREMLSVNDGSKNLICYPALEYEEWRIITGSDPKNTPWSYHNGGSWPTLLWQFTLACIKMGRLELAQKAVALAEKRLAVDRWPEYYDTRTGKFIGKQSRLFQTWTIAGFLASKMIVENPEMASLLFWEEDYELLEICVCALSKTGRKKCSRVAAKSQILV
ncbi:hypothetical protein QYF36_024825 [Acer negundo]|nr:hypothetical protein QYF36_024825 [Acer negundo]